MSGAAPACLLASAWIIVSATTAPLASAQDFTPAAAAGPTDSPSAWLDRGLPRGGGASAEVLSTQWLGVPGLVTRAACAGVAVRSVCAAAGGSQTGDEDVGWTALGAALGTRVQAGGAAIRAVARRERSAAAGSGGARNGLELGGGAWLDVRAGLTVWARAPQLATAGLSPPLPRALAVGVAFARGGIDGWFEREAPARRADDTGVQAAGVGLELAGSRVWVEGRSRPLRAGFGVEVHAGALVIGVRALDHPQLGDTVTLSLGARARRP